MTADGVQEEGFRGTHFMTLQQEPDFARVPERETDIPTTSKPTDHAAQPHLDDDIAFLARFGIPLAQLTEAQKRARLFNQPASEPRCSGA